MAYVGAEEPHAVSYVIHYVKRHDERGHERVRHCQAHNEAILNALQRFVGKHGQHHKHITKHAHIPDEQVDQA